MSEEPLQPRSLGEPASAEPPRRPTTSSRSVWVYVLVLLVVGLGVIGWISRRSPPPPPPAAPTATPRAAPTPTADPALRLAAEQALEELIGVLAPLENAAPELWAAERWERVNLQSQQGDEALAENRWADAEASYRQALDGARSLQAELGEVPSRLMPEARQAYAEGDRVKAVGLIRAVLQMEPEHPEAADLLPRAEVADQTFAKLEQAKTHLENGELELAYVEVVQALAADDRFPGGAELQTSIANQLTESELQTLIGRALLALDAGDVETAQAATREAVALAPEHEAVLDLQQQVDARILEQSILALKEQADALQQREKWEEAHKLWLKIESLDPDAPWVLQGLSDSLRWAVVNEKLTQGLRNPGGLQAETWVKEFQNREGWPAGLDQKAGLLEKEWRAWTTPVPVVLVSDGETRITVSRKGRWTDVFRKEIRMLPGSYVARGDRLGYRDVRVEFEVAPGGEEIEVEVICTEGI